ncbi:MAG TPA: MmgE/PrpD family protein [Candidatus Binatia bacterium]|jgi:2-methylcitrate dehydratase PrpD
MADESLSERLAGHYASLRIDKIPDAVVSAARLHILDTLGCLLAGSRLEPGKRAYDLAAGARGNDATLIGSGARASYLDAAQAMAVAAHCGEMDDIHGGAGTCIGAMVVPALLALAQKNGGGGASFLEAAVAGYETTARVGLAVDAPALFAKGWWPSTVCGAFGVAAAAAKFLEWSPDKTANALGIASLYSGGMITGGAEGATARHLIFGHAARNGLLALSAAEAGFTGPRKAFEDPRGFCLTLCASPKWEYLKNLESYFLPEVAFKPYPCARHLHAGVEALLTLMQQHAIDPSSINEIILSVPTANAGMVNRPAPPQNRAAALGSGQYVMAATAIGGKMDLSSFEDAMLNDVRVRDLLSRVAVHGERELDHYFPQSWPGRVRVVLNGGRSHTHEIIVPKGEGANPMSEREIEEKFLSLAAPILGERAQSVVDALQSLDRRESVSDLLAALGG